MLGLTLLLSRFDRELLAFEIRKSYWYYIRIGDRLDWMVDCFSLAGDVGFLGLLVVGGLDEAEDIIYRYLSIFMR